MGHDVSNEKAGPSLELGNTVSDNEVGQGDVTESSDGTTHRGLKSRHAQMIAIGGTIGTGVFVGTGQTLARGGPAFILIAYIFMGFMSYLVLTAITEIASYLPVKGSSMNLFGQRFVSRSLGFSLGWLYFYSLGILVPYEITAAGLVIEYWNPPVNIAVWITIIMVVIVGLNALPVRYYGETEFWFASTKVIAIIGLFIVSIVIFFGGGPTHDATYFRYWKNPGAANTYMAEGNTGRFIALLSTLVLSAFPFTFCPELLVISAGEMKQPRYNLPIAARRYIIRIVVFYVGSVLAIGLICPSDDPALTSGGKGAGASPFVVGMKTAGIKVLDSIINAVIIISAWSSGNSYLYLSSRSLYSLAVSGNAPKFFKVCTKDGVPARAVAASSLFCLLAYLNLAASGSTVFNWFVSLTNTSGFISWICCCVIYLRFRKACKAQGVVDLPFQSKLQPYGAYFGIGVFVFLTLINGFTVFWPENWSASTFLTAYLGIPVFLILYFGHRIYARQDRWAYPPETADLTTGLQEILEQEDPTKRPGPMPWYMWPTKIWS